MNNVIRRSLLKRSSSIKTLLLNNAGRSLSSANTLIKTKKFNELKSDHIDTFRQIIGQNGVKTEDLEGYNTDWLKIHKGLYSKIVEKVVQFF